MGICRLHFLNETQNHQLDFKLFIYFTEDIINNVKYVKHRSATIIPLSENSFVARELVSARVIPHILKSSVGISKLFIASGILFLIILKTPQYWQQC